MRLVIAQIDASPDLLTIREVAALLRVDRSYVYRLVRTGRLPAVCPTPHKTWVPKAGLQAFLEAAYPAASLPTSSALSEVDHVA